MKAMSPDLQGAGGALAISIEGDGLWMLDGKGIGALAAEMATYRQPLGMRGASLMRHPRQGPPDELRLQVLQPLQRLLAEWGTLC